MKIILQIISIIGLLLTVGPSIMYFRGSIGFEDVHKLMLIGFVVWFASAIFWLGKKQVYED